jgi:hypothetical protein
MCSGSRCSLLNGAKMNKKPEGIRVTDIPLDFYNSATKQLINYGIGIVKIIEKELTEDAILIGSGTLVDIDRNLGILTAQHVIDALPADGIIGFIISEKLHKFSLDAQTLTAIRVGRGQDPSSGPDLGFIKLPNVILGSIKALKSFYNVGIKRDKILQEPPENDLGVWCICGIPNEETRHEGPSRGFETVKGFVEFCGFGGVSKQYCSGEFDYFNFDVHYSEGTQSPISFGGVSGGGLWQAVIAQKPDGELVLKEAILSGVAFYQSPLVDNKRIIKCHGRQSIYNQLYNTVKKECS